MYKYKHMHVYIYEKYVVYMLNIFIWNIKYKNRNIHVNIYFMCAYLYINNKYT